MSKQGKHTPGRPIKIDHDLVTDIVTIDGYPFSGEFLRHITASEPGIRFRIIKREGGCITISQERDPLEAAARDMLAALKEIEEWWLTEEMARHTGAPHAIFATRAAIVKAESQSQ